MWLLREGRSDLFCIQLGCGEGIDRLEEDVLQRLRRCGSLLRIIEHQVLRYDNNKSYDLIITAATTNQV